MALADLKAVALDLLNTLKLRLRPDPLCLQDQVTQLSSNMSHLESEFAQLSGELKTNQGLLQTIESNTSDLRDALERRPPTLMPFCLFLGFIILCVGLGLDAKPSSDAEAVMGGQFRVGVPYVVRNAGGGIVKATNVRWAESHSQDLSFLSQTLPPVPKVETGHTRILLTTVFEKDVASDIPIDLAVELPNDASFNWCDREFDWQQAPDCHLSEDKIAPGSSDRTIKVAGLLSKSTRQFGVYMDISDVDGISFVETRSRVNMRFPTLMPMPTLLINDEFNEYRGRPDLEIGTGVAMAGADQVIWTDRPSELTNTYAGWHVTTPPFSAAPPGMVSGVKDRVLRGDSESSFWAGLWLGLAGACAVAAIQILVSWWRGRD